jgi:hypothetical protein
VRKSKRKRFLDPNLPVKKLWRNLDSVGMRETVDDNFIYTPDQLNTFFAIPKTVRPNNTGFDSTYNFLTGEFAFINTFELKVYNERNGMMSRLQPGLRSNHSTTTALPKITIDLLLV